MVAGLEHFLSSAGYAAIFLLTVAQCCGFPVSSEVVLPFTGVLVALGTLSLPLAIIVALVGELVGAMISYGLGIWVGREALLRWGARFHLRESHLQAAERFYQRRGVVAVAVGRITPVIRSYTSYPAGFAEMPLIKFIPATLVGAVVWDTALIVAGMELGKHFSLIGKVIKPIEYIAAFAIIVLILYGLWRYINRPATQLQERD